MNKTRLKAMAEKGNKRAKQTLELAETYDKLISTVLIGNNIVNIATASIGTLFFVDLLGSVGATVSTVVITIVVLIFGEITPKSIAKDYPEKFAMFSAPLIHLLMCVLTPLNYIFSQWKNLVSSLLRSGDESKMSQEELLFLLEEVEQEGAIDENEGELLRNAVEFGGLEAKDILTHRVDLEGVSVEASKEEVAELFTQTRFSRLLVYEETIDKIVGVLHLKDFYDGMGINPKPLREIMTPPLFIHQTEKVDDLLQLLKSSKSHIAVVIDEYGGTLGIVTMEDILEELVGEIWDEHDEVEEPIRAVGEGAYAVMGQASAEKLFEELGLSEETEAATVGGWVMEQLGRIPAQGESFSFGGYRFTVEEMNYQQIIRLTVQAEQPSVQAAQPAE